jgi:hypothetical protein
MSTRGWRGKPAQRPKTGRLSDRKLALEMSPEFFGAPSLRSAFPFGTGRPGQLRLRRVLLGSLPMVAHVWFCGGGDGREDLRAAPLHSDSSSYADPSRAHAGPSIL